MQVKSIAECSPWSILQYFRSPFSYHLPIRFLFEWPLKTGYTVQYYVQEVCQTGPLLIFAGESESVASHLSAYADSSEFLDGHRRSVSDLDLLDKPPSLSSSVSSLSEQSHQDDFAFTVGDPLIYKVAPPEPQAYGNAGHLELLPYGSDTIVNQSTKPRPQSHKDQNHQSRQQSQKDQNHQSSFQKTDSITIIKPTEVKDGYGHLGFEGCGNDLNRVVGNDLNRVVGNDLYRVVGNDLENDINSDLNDKRMDRPPSEYVSKDVIIEDKETVDKEQGVKQQYSERKHSVNSLQSKGSVYSDGKSNNSGSGIKIVVNSISKAPDSKAPDSKVPDSKAPDSKAPDSKAPDSDKTATAPAPVPPPPPPPPPTPLTPGIADPPAAPPVANGHVPPPPPPPPVDTSQASPANQLVNGVNLREKTTADRAEKPR